MLPLLRVFGLTIQTPALAQLLGFALGLMVTSRHAFDRRLDGGAITDAGFYGAIVGVISARIGYVVSHWSAYSLEPFSALMPNTTALLSWVGWPAGIVFAVILLWRKKQLRVELFDPLALGLTLFTMGLSLGSLLSGDAFGSVAQLPWSIYLWNAWRHPVQLYEFVVLGIIFVLLVRISAVPRQPGLLMLIFAMLYGLARVWLDAYRAEAPLLLGLRASQVTGTVVSAAAMWLIGVLLERTNQARSVPIIPDSD